MRELIRKIIHETNKEKDESAKFIKCRECKKKFTQTIHKGKKSLPICPHCGAHNTDTKKEIDETLDVSNNLQAIIRRHIYSLESEISKICELFYGGYVSSRAFCKNFPSYVDYLTAVQDYVMLTKVATKIPKGVGEIDEILSYGRKVIELTYGDYIYEFYNKKCKTKSRNSVKEGFTDLILKKLNKYPFHEYQKTVDNFMNLQKLKIQEDNGILRETHLVNPSGEVVIKVKDSLTKGGQVIYVSWRLMNELEGFIPARGLVICVAKWVEKTLKLDNVVGWEIFLD